jgi:hypothetical protein
MKFKKEPSLSIIFRILTPEEIQELTSTSRGGEKTPLNDLLLEEIVRLEESPIGQVESKVLKLKFPGDEVELNQSPIEEGMLVVSNKISETKGPALVIELKGRMQKSQSKLKSKEIMDLYKKLGEQDIEQQKLNNDDLKKAVNSGILINRRQF